MKPERIEYLMSLTPDAMCEEATDAELLHLLRCARERDELRSPLWTCVGCGRVERDGWKSQKYEAGDEDIVCPECGSTDVREHPREVLTQVISERDELRAERDRAVARATSRKLKNQSHAEWRKLCARVGTARATIKKRERRIIALAALRDELRARVEKAEARAKELEDSLLQAVFDIEDLGRVRTETVENARSLARNQLPKHRAVLAQKEPR